jgi:LPP20 lipoprotein
MKKGIIPLFLLLFFSSFSFGQQYPLWFIYPDKIECDEHEVGYSITGYYSDSSKVVAFKNGCVNHARNALVRIEGGQGFWETENGTYWMGAEINESFDTTSIQLFEKNLKLVSSFSNDGLTISLLCNSKDELSATESEILDFNDLPSPSWINHLPNNDNYTFAIGITPKYFYETSSWLEAEKLARINLARQLSVQIKSLQKSTKMGQQEIRNEEFSVILRNISIAERWIDTERNIFYVLIKMPI